MTEITRDYVQLMPSSRFIGMKYGDEDRVNGGFGEQWGSWFAADRFKPLEALVDDEFRGAYEDADAYVGLMRWKENEPFEYWIGMFLPQDAVVPDGYGFIDKPEDKLGVCWLRGTEPDIYGKEHLCAERLGKAGYEISQAADGAWWFFERYVCPRFTEKDEAGQVILDICHYVK
ncbi:hypothetical protein [Gorillibacterium massiliense]|uniref:hypothetical protein n=1 Tax=Gorillibacterium massiliense TaxID=1280390 RepID=UPI0004B659CF|nr:hypothetical protein [Gorillibacterium massiliense]